ncbi:MAG: multifunctional oxoglutarate decarboxylase/oxoglutarate dehydrogenase thiamine pyrophosphate-binding subunit/dihydrolipoyllysine-residue succinyltransferase subunit [Angustibacter sp.]
MSQKSSQTEPSNDPVLAFGPNEWLVDELYQRYLHDKTSVDRAWWQFFEDYPAGRAAGSDDGTRQPPGGTSESATSADATAPAPAPAPTAEAALRRHREPQSPATSEAVDTGIDSGLATGRAATVSANVTPPAPEPGPAHPGPAHPGPAGPERTGDGTAPDAGGPLASPMRGAAARVVTNMQASLQVPTATSVRAVPAKLLIDNRIVINNHLSRSRGGKVSFTHLIGYAVVKAVIAMPEMNRAFGEQGGKPVLLQPADVALGLAIDVAKPDGGRQLLVPSIKRAQTMDFAQFWTAYEDVVRRTRAGKLAVDDFAGTTISLTNPGTIGTNHSVPRLMNGQGTIVGVGSLEYPAEWQGASAETVARSAISKILTLTSTYDHRIIQGAQSGEFLRRVHQLLLGEDGFYDEVFRSLRIPYEPIRWVQDISTSHDDEISKSARVQELIHAYRVRGHLMADTDPLEYRQRRHPDLDVTTHALTLWDLDREFPTGGFGGKPFMKLRHILGVLRDSYCRTVGIEYMHIQDPEQRRWIQDTIERPYAKTSPDEQQRILRRLNAAEAFETFLQTKYVGQKRFSLEGGESVIALLDRVLSRAAGEGLDEVCIGMPHRGRLNVLANLAGKSYAQIFREFDGTQDPRSVQGSGDVKYHLGTEGKFISEDGATTKVYLAANPSHLEAVDPVLEGIVRAKQDRLDLGGQAFTVLPVLLHGDAAFAGQGVVAETLNLSQLRGYRTGGTIHVVINNQVGFTTSPSASRSSFYSTDVARMIQAPIFHVNGDDPEACVRVAELAFEFRQEFAKDVVIDMVCYRRRGHNEGDDPSMTQPLMYRLIEAKRSVRKLYTEALIGRGDLTVDEASAALRDYQAQLERVFTETRDAAGSSTDTGTGAGLERPSAQVAGDRIVVSRPSAIEPAVLHRIGDAFSATPDNFTVHPKLKQLLSRRTAMTRDGNVDWATAELIAFGSLLMEQTPVRLAGQDSRRGTFVQRHSVLIDARTAEEWTPLLYLSPDQARFWVYDSLLSEFAAMGFEYGYSVERPDALVLWEAQFGDFVNGAQTILDEFVSCSEQKWGQHSSVVLLLPHGFEGQGPDHSSARIERFLQMCAEDNMTVAMPSTPASYFHLLRRQAYARPRRPLIVFTPKSMLRLKAAVSGTSDLTSGEFRAVIPDSTADPAGVDRVLLCSGKIAWALEASRAERRDQRTAIVRVEQLAPLPIEQILAQLSTYPRAEVIWVQEEPANMGPWPHVALTLSEHLGGRSLHRVSRPASAAPARGSTAWHELEQRTVIEHALGR